MRESKLTVGRVRELLTYDSETGIFRWLVRPSSQVPAGSIAGSTDKRHGYVMIGIDTRLYFAHRIAWLYVTGAWPQHRIDHRNGFKGDNKFCNLRDVTQGVNLQNQRSPHSNNVSGYLGVSIDRARGGWVATIKTDGKNKFLGRFDDPKEASSAYLAAKSRLHVGSML